MTTTSIPIRPAYTLAVTEEQKLINGLFAQAAAGDQQSRALMQLRKLFYEQKRVCETLQAEGGGESYWDANPEKRRRLDEATHLCRRIAQLFSAMKLGLYEKSVKVSPQKVVELTPGAYHNGRSVDGPVALTSGTLVPPKSFAKLPRLYTGLGE